MIKHVGVFRNKSIAINCCQESHCSLRSLTNKTLREQYKIHIIYSVIFIIILPFLISCTVTWKDISNNREYTSMIGKVFISKERMKVSGIMSDYTSGSIDYYIITTLPGIGGREVVDIGYLPKGSYLKIVKVVKSDPSRVAMQDIRFVVEILNNSSFAGMHASIDSMDKTYTEISGKRNLYNLSSEYFEEN